jgi:hypothetical protein
MMSGSSRFYPLYFLLPHLSSFIFLLHPSNPLVGPHISSRPLILHSAPSLLVSSAHSTPTGAGVSLCLLSPSALPHRRRHIGGFPSSRAPLLPSSSSSPAPSPVRSATGGSVGGPGSGCIPLRFGGGEVILGRAALSPGRRSSDPAALGISSNGSPTSASLVLHLNPASGEEKWSSATRGPPNPCLDRCEETTSVD